VGWADRSIAGGLGVMADDMIAGLFAGLGVALARLVVPL
jgi:phosphatidylglycerophosphatase A